MFCLEKRSLGYIAAVSKYLNAGGKETRPVLFVPSNRSGSCREVALGWISLGAVQKQSWLLWRLRSARLDHPSPVSRSAEGIPALPQIGPRALPLRRGKGGGPFRREEPWRGGPGRCVAGRTLFPVHCEVPSPQARGGGGGACGVGEMSGRPDFIPLKFLPDEARNLPPPKLTDPQIFYTGLMGYCAGLLNNLLNRRPVVTVYIASSCMPLHSFLRDITLLNEKTLSMLKRTVICFSI
uniref:NADH dehydrogenase [ubiquinone] 1 subunit C2 isoform X2 n=1 Tax=Phascolarctos cinereus TaxID=38626 RepID=A0A6P5KKM3_PHACI|nr:NADH dehydrogenase [ubiquinone] 1 subunit C2 isoform X2 [Phascolarctos cinereus]